MFDPEPPKLTLLGEACLPCFSQSFCIFSHPHSFSLLWPSNSTPSLLWAYLCAKEAVIGHQQGHCGFAVNRELLHREALWLTCSKALFDGFWTGGCVWDKGKVALLYFGAD